MTMTMSISTIQSVGYYEDLARQDYYESGGEPPGQYVGSGAEALGLQGELTQGQLGLLLQGFHPTTGKALASNAGEDHRAGFDLCFSAPKSVSTIWAATEDEGLRAAIQKAQQGAVEKSIAYAENSGIAQVRRGKGGAEKSPAKLIAASYEHGTSRAEDPQLHTHTLVASHGIDASDGSIKSIDSISIFRSQKEMGAVYRAELAQSMRELGFTVERDGQAFRIAGTDKDLEKLWSKRREEIETRMKETGRHSAKEAEIAAMASRSVKNHIDRQSLLKQWQNDANEHDFNVEDIREDRTDLKVDSAEVLQTLTEMKAVFSETALKTELLQQLQGVGTADDLDQLLEEMNTNGSLIKLGLDESGRPVFTTKEMLQLEKKVVEFAESTQENKAHSVTHESINSAIANKAGISLEQQQALRHVCASGQVCSITGAAGTGKSFMLAAAKETYQANGFNVIGCSLSGKAAAELEGGSGIKSQTIHSLVIELENGKRSLNSNDIIVMDEAGMTDTRLMSRVIDQVKGSGAKLVLVGDTQQLQAVGAGGVFAHISEKIGTAEILTVRRQQVEWQRQAATDIREGRSVASLKAFKDHDRLTIAESNADAHKQVVSAWRKSDTSMQEKLMISGRRVDVASLNREARNQLQSAGKLKAEVPVALKDRETGQTRTLDVARGERLRLLKNDRDLDVKNGDLGTVKRIEFNGDSVRLHVELDRGGSRIINPAEYPKMMHGYAITAHASQGATVDAAFFYASSFNSKELAYVASSRHRKDAHIFASKEELGEEPMQRLEKSFAKNDEKHTALKLQEAEQKKEDEKDEKQEEAELKDEAQETHTKQHDAVTDVLDEIIDDMNDLVDSEINSNDAESAEVEIELE